MSDSRTPVSAEPASARPTPSDPRLAGRPVAPRARSARRAVADSLGLESPADPAHGVEIIDTPSVVVHHQADVLNLVLSTLGIGLMLLLAVYAHGTTEGVTEDVRTVSSVLRQILVIPVNALESFITIVLPLWVVADLAFRRLGRQVFEALAAAVLALALSLAVLWTVRTWGSTGLVASLSIWDKGVRTLALPSLVTAIAGLLTAAGTRARRRSIRWSWNLLWTALAVSLVTGQVTLPGVGITVLLGRVAGFGVRFLGGVSSERAYGAELVAGIRRAGFQPIRLVRIDGDLEEGHVTATATEAAKEPAAEALARSGDKRVYAMTTEDHERFDVIALDGDRRVAGVLTQFWRSIRLQGIDRRGVVSLRQVAERSALIAYTARAAGVRTPRMFGLAEAVDSMLLIQQHPIDAVPLRDIPEPELTDEVLDRIWRQVQLAHDAGIAHRALTSDVVLLGGVAAAATGRIPQVTEHDTPLGDSSPLAQVWLTSWENGDVASSELARRLDLVQLIALLALRVGAERAVASASRVLDDDELAAIGPLLQTVVLPRSTQDEARQHKGVITELRTALVSRIPQAVVEPEPIVKFGARRVLTIMAAIIAVWVVIGTMNFSEITTALGSASPWWSLAAFLVGLLSFVGAAVALMAFSPIPLNGWHVLLTQVAASFASLVAPAGVGPAALNLRMLTKRGVNTSLSVATVALVQVSGFLTTIALLFGLSLVTGSGGALRGLPSGTILVALLLIAIAVAITFLVPAAREWILRKTVPVLQQTWPRLAQILGQPGRLALGLGGNLLMTVGYLAAFYASLQAFGRELHVVDLAVVYLLGNALGSAAPTPGGIGTVELALGGALAGAGIPTAIAASVVVLFRVATYWIRIPLGWFAMRHLERVDAL